MNISKINMNLLVVLDALLTEQHVTRAGKKVHLTQSAVSNALKQLRAIFHDELLVRGQSGKMNLTYKAKTLVEPVKKALQQASIVFSEEKDFDPSTEKTCFNIGMSDYTSLIILPKLIKRVEHYAPNITINVSHLNDVKEIDDFIAPRLDLAIGCFFSPPELLKTQRLFSDRRVWVADKKHPAFKSEKSLEENYMNYQHLVVIYKKEAPDKMIKDILKRIKREHADIIIVPHMLVAISILQNTNLICTSRYKVARIFEKKFNLAIRDMPFPSKKFITSQYWRRESDNDPKIKWLRNQIKEISEEIESE